MSIQQPNKKPLQVVDLLLTNGRSERDEVGQQPNERRTNYEVLRSTWSAWMDLNHILISGEKKMIDIMTYNVSGAASNITHSPIGQFVMTSPVEFSFAPTNQEKKPFFRKSRRDVSIIYNARQGFKGQGPKLCCLNWTLRIFNRLKSQW